MKKFYWLVLITLISAPLFAAVTALNVVNVGSNGKYIEADSANNPVLHIQITADTQGDTLTYLGVENYRDSWYLGAADEPASIAPGGVKLWYMAADSSVFSTSTAVLISTLPSEDTHVGGGATNWWYENFSAVVSNGSGLWVTIDTSLNPNSSSVEFTAESAVFSSGASIDIYDRPDSPPVMLITQSTAADNLEISKTGGTMQPYISTSQDTIIPFALNFYNNSGMNSASCSVSSITISVQSYSPLGVTLVPGTVISNIKIQDKNFGTIYGNVTRSQMPTGATAISIPVSLLNIPANTTITANVVISATTITAYAGTNFVMSVGNEESIYAYDYYTLKRVPVKGAEFDSTSFPLYSNFSVLQKQSSALNVSGSAAVMPGNINKGQKDVPLMKLYLSNPGDTLTAAAEVYNLKFSAFDGSAAPVIPSDIFDRIVVTDESGSMTYGLKSGSSIESSGNTINFPLLNTIGVLSGMSVTLTVRADIALSASPSSFYISAAGQNSILARDINSFTSVPAAAHPSWPINSGTALLSGSFRLAVPSVMPKNLYAGASSVMVMQAVLSAPVAFGAGNSLAARGITITAKNSSGDPVNFSGCFSSLRMTASSPSVSLEKTFSSLPALDKFCAYFDSPFAMTDTADTIISLYADIKPDASGSVALSIESGDDVNVYQFNDTSRDIYVALASGQNFPVSSGTGNINGSSSSLSFSSYPNPFRAGASAVISYNLPSDSDVTICVYDATGTLIRTILKKQRKQKGGHEEESWNGRNEDGKTVPAGTYVIKINAEANGVKLSMTKTVTIIK